MKKILILFILLFLEANSQKSAKINYSVLPLNGTIENSDDVKKTSISNNFIGIDNALTRLDYELLIYENKSYFYMVSSLDVNDRASRLAKSFAGSGDFFTNKNTEELIKTFSILGQTFNVSSKINTNWILTNELKTINGYVCYKATQLKNMRLKKTSKEIIAWYCPSIPLSFGPKDFSGLPGLIMELQDGKVIFLINKINLNAEIENKFKVIKGKIITEEEFNVIYDEMLKKVVDELPKK